MQSHPQLGRRFRQEWYQGQAEDVFKVIDRSAAVTVPYGSFRHALRTEETNALEPNVLDNKYYVRGHRRGRGTVGQGPPGNAQARRDHLLTDPVSMDGGPPGPDLVRWATVSGWFADRQATLDRSGWSRPAIAGATPNAERAAGLPVHRPRLSGWRRRPKDQDRLYGGCSRGPPRRRAIWTTGHKDRVDHPERHAGRSRCWSPW